MRDLADSAMRSSMKDPAVAPSKMRTTRGRVGSRAPVQAEAVLPRKKVAERLVQEEERYHQVQGRLSWRIRKPNLS